MKLDLVILIVGLVVGYFEQSRWVFLSAIAIYAYRALEVNYFKTQYTFVAKKAYEQSSWTTTTAILFLLWIIYLMYLSMGLLFKG